MRKITRTPGQSATGFVSPVIHFELTATATR